MDSVIERVRKLATEGVFGKGKLKDIKNQTNEGIGSQFASQLSFLNVDLLDPTGELCEIPVIVKIEPDETVREEFSVHLQFANEVTMYNQILPQLGAEDLEITPKMFYGLATRGVTPNEDLIILEDLRHQGFRLAKDLFLDYEHLTLSLRALGKFHGLSYRMKKCSQELLLTLGKSLEIKTYEDPDGSLARSVLRGIKPLLENPSYSYLGEVFKILTEKDTWTYLKKPEEPFAVILHGDFNRNNMLFDYENNQVASVKFIDFGTSLYSDPVIDISFFLYMNTSEELRAEHWDDLLEEYWKGVTSIVVEPGFSFEAFLKNFAKKAVWSYVLCSFFLPMMLFPEESVVGSEEMSLEQKLDSAENYGGEKATEAVTSVVRHLSDQGYMEAFLLHFAKNKVPII